MELILNNAVVMQEMARHLSPHDILSLRLVSRSINIAVQSAFHKHVPVWLDELDIKGFTAEEGPLEQRGMLNEEFHLTVRPTTERRVQALLDFSLKFSSQIKSLTILTGPLWDEIRHLMDILAPLSGTLRELTIVLAINNTEEIPFRMGGRINYPIMEKLRRLEFTDDNPDLEEPKGACGEHGEKGLSPFPFFCPNLEELSFTSFSDLQESFSEQLIKNPGKLTKLKSLELHHCTINTMKHFTNAKLVSQIQRLVLFPICEEGMHESLRTRDWGLPVAINNLLQAVSKEITILDLQLKTVFASCFDEDGYDFSQKFPTLPQMPKLKTLVFSAVDASDVSSLFDHDEILEIEFEETPGGAPDDPVMIELFPSLESLTIIETEQVYPSRFFLGLRSHHLGLKEFRVEMKRSTRDWERARMRTVEEARLGFPNAQLVINNSSPIPEH